MARNRNTAYNTVVNMTVEEITYAANAAGTLLPKTVASVDDAVSTVVNDFGRQFAKVCL